jgi:hypothetical protein
LCLEAEYRWLVGISTIAVELALIAGVVIRMSGRTV